MDYSIFASIYEKLESVSSKLAKTGIIAEFLKSVPTNELSKIVLLLQGLVFPISSQSELGVASQMMIKAISKASGFSAEKVEDMFKKTGDLGLTAEQCVKSKRQSSLLKKKLTVDHVFENLQKLATITGEGSQDRKLNLMSELIISAQPQEARYIVRTILGELRVGAAEGLIRDAIVNAFLVDEKSTKDEKEKATESVENAWNILSDFGEVSTIAKDRGVAGLKKIKVHLGKPIQVMLAEKAESIPELIKKYGKIAIEVKYDGARISIHKKGNDFKLYTRRLEDVTKQFPDLIALSKKALMPTECIVEGEVLGINPKNGRPLPFQILSQRIHRKYDINKMIRDIPIQMNLFDIVYVDGRMLFDKPLMERRKILEKNVKPIPDKFQLAEQLITDDVKEAQAFYKRALEANQEGAMVKVLNAPYVFGRHVDGWMKIKETLEPLELVVVGATHGEGARSKWLTSYILACRDPDTGELLECGMMSTGLSESEYAEITKALKSLIVNEKGRTVYVKPKIVLEVEYQEIQKSPNYESGYALRFPALRAIRWDRSPEDATDINRLKKIYESQGRAG